MDTRRTVVLKLAAAAVLLAVAAPARAGVVINEVFYNAPDDLDDLQFVELHNPDATPVSLAGWKFTRGITFEFPAGTTLAPGGYVVVCKSLREFRKYYGFDAAGQYTGSLSHNGETIELRDAAGKKVDAVKYGSRPPWPVAADGYGSSLERICPTAPADVPENWAPSPLASGPPKPGGTPGKRNAVYAAALPPVVTDVTFTPPHATPTEPIRVQATVRATGELKGVELRYRVAGTGVERDEIAVPMTREPNGTFTATIPAQKPRQIVRFRIRATDAAGDRYFPHPNELRPALSVYVHDSFEKAKVPLGFVVNVGQQAFRAGQQVGGQPYGAPPLPSPPARGQSAFVYVDPATGTPQLFDFITVRPRNSGRKVHFHKDRPLAGMTTINLIYEYMDRFALAEHMAYEVYRKAGLAAPRTDHVRTWVDGRSLGFQLLIEQPNKAFLRHNNVSPDGNLYKAVWFGDTVVNRHEKKSNTHTGHDDLVKVINLLNSTRGDEQWAVIKREFDVEQVATYFAVRTLLSDWDGFFNNYYAYHDTRKTGKWTMYPWDQDKTWGFHDGTQGYQVFFDMPITHGMAGDQPRGNTAWWRPGGDFSKPMLANPHFRRVFLAKTKELLQTVYTEEAIFPLIKAMGERLEDEVKARAVLHGQDPKAATVQFHRTLDTLREHLKKRREFLLRQDEVKNAPKFDPAVLK